jgi:1,2-diacylglycerol 3-beta-glucosyltransferase
VSTVVLIVRWVVSGLLTVYMLRRYMLLVASHLPPRRTLRTSHRSLVILVAGRNEQWGLPTLLAAMERLRYPARLVQVVLVSDGSDDGTADLMAGWQTSPFATEVVSLPQSVGKGAALAAGLARARASELVVVFDADCEPRDDVLEVLCGAFEDPLVGAATGYPRPDNANATMVSRYAALERWTHHLVVLAGEDRLSLDPSIIGAAFAIRRQALSDAGGFPQGRLSEDTVLSMAVVAAGWKLRWLRDAVVRENVVDHLGPFYTQRTRWGRGMLESAPGVRSLEHLFVVAGYLDRVVVVVALALVPFGVLSVWWPIAYFFAPALCAATALHRAGARPAWRFAWAAAVMLAADLFVSVRSMVGQVLGTPVEWGRRSWGVVSDAPVPVLQHADRVGPVRHSFNERIMTKREGPSSGFATIIGLFLLIEGVWGMFSPVVFGVLTTNMLHAAIHIVLGLIGLYTGRRGGARAFSLYLGILLIVVGVMRFVPVLGDITVSLLNVNQAVAIFNIVVGIIAVMVSRSGPMVTRPMP